MNEAAEPGKVPTDAGQRIIVAVDFSEDAQAALLWACRYATRVDGEIVLLHVVHDPASSPGFYRKSSDSLFRPMHAVAESMMTEFLERFVDHHPEYGFLFDLAPHFVPGLPPTRIGRIAGVCQQC